MLYYYYDVTTHNVLGHSLSILQQGASAKEPWESAQASFHLPASWGEGNSGLLNTRRAWPQAVD